MENLRLSLSKTKTFLNCKKQYKYNYILKIPQQEQIYHTFGKFAHKILEDFHNSYINGSKESFSKEMNIAWKNAVNEFSAKLTPELRKECWGIVDSYLKKIYKLQKQNLLPDVLFCEKDFSINLKEDLVLNGAIDRIQRDKDGILHVVDYKTTKNKKYLKDDYFQLITYAFVLLQDYPDEQKIRGSYSLLRHNFEDVVFEFSKEDILKIKDKYINYADQIIKEVDFAANVNNLCPWCPYASLCDDYKKKQTNTFGEVSW